MRENPHPVHGKEVTSKESVSSRIGKSKSYSVSMSDKGATLYQRYKIPLHMGYGGIGLIGMYG